jgi:hypothetical protein
MHHSILGRAALHPRPPAHSAAQLEPNPKAAGHG